MSTLASELDLIRLTESARRLTGSAAPREPEQTKLTDLCPVRVDYRESGIVQLCNASTGEVIQELRPGQHVVISVDNEETGSKK